MAKTNQVTGIGSYMSGETAGLIGRWRRGRSLQAGQVTGRRVSHCSLITFLRVTVATHVTARGLRVTRSSEFTKMRSFSHDSVPIAKKSVPIRIETQARGFTEDKTVIFSGWRRHVMTFGKTITSMSRDNDRPARQRLVTCVNRHVAKGLT